jgi:uncharacterized protein (TIGR03435 family)
MRIDSRELLAVGIFGSRSHIVDRIEALLSRGRPFSPRASAARITASAVVLGSLLFAGSFAPPWIAFAQQQPQHPSFEVASIKTALAPSAGKPVLFGMKSDPNRFRGSYVTLQDLIAKAYGVPNARISGGAPWVTSDRYEVVANLPPDTPSEQVPLALRKLLSERFRLVIRRETKTSRVYALIPAKGGPKLVRPEAEPSPSQGGTQPPMLSSAPLTISAKGALGICCGHAKLHKVSMGLFAELLSSQTDRPVKDATGIEGEFDVSLEWTPDTTEPQLDGTPSPTGPSIYTALQEQLGLRLEPRNAPLEYLVIDRVEKPDAN